MYNSPFKWWVQSVMPVVFDDSLSYYEVLAKLTKYIEGLTGDVQEIEKVLETIDGIEDVAEFTKFLETIQTEIGNLNNLQTDSKNNLVNAINEVALKANIAYKKPPSGIPESDLDQSVRDKLNNSGGSTTDNYIINNVTLKKAPNNNSPADLGLGTYSVPEGGIPWSILSQDVRDRIESGGGGTGGTKDYNELNNKPQINGHTLNAGNNTLENLGIGTYNKPEGGIPESDLDSQVQEKLNTSGGIADSESTFIATRNYEAGELIYIDGVLYKTKYVILNGTNLIPGNNIEVTDISNEIARINGEIDALQSGSGPDSWSLSATLTTARRTNFFEYFNAIGNESYLFIIDPVSSNPSHFYYEYILRVCKRDGTEVLNYRPGSSDAAKLQQRVTFTPVDTGEYYCTLEPYSSSYSDISTYRITLEYTESQGISELWNQVNQARQVEPRVGALETLVGEQQTELDELDNIPERVEALETDVDNLKNNLNKINGDIYEKPELTDFVWEYGNINSSNGKNSDTGTIDNTRVRTSNFIRLVEGAILSVPDTIPSNYRIYIVRYNAPELVNAAFIETTPALRRTKVSYTNVSECYIRIYAQKSDNTAFTSADEVLSYLTLNNNLIFVLTVDSEFSETSEKPIQNKVVTEKFNQISDTYYPSYYNAEVAEVIDEVRRKNALSSTGDTLIFVTDLHYQSVAGTANTDNAGHTLALAKAVAQRTNNKLFVCAGDILSKDHTRTEALKLLWGFINDEQKKFGENYRMLVGNHDFNATQTDSTQVKARTLTEAEMYALFIKGFEHKVVSDASLHYYWDNENQKTRYICFNTGVGVSMAYGNSYVWYNSALLSAPEGYRIVVLAHGIFSSYTNSTTYSIGNSMRVMLEQSDTFNTRGSIEINHITYDYSSIMNKKIVLMMCGHTHGDGYTYFGESLIPIVITSMDAYAVVSDYAGTVDEHAIDFVNLDYTNDKAYFTRLGRHTERTRSFDLVSL